ncbi:hypothetical protein B0H14DRAFT_3556930 [Mycena olivaceomarginata]|nr:hypothetical protein B0H14DRAFT_3556930 [Mycena olivaceomarginata]
MPPPPPLRLRASRRPLWLRALTATFSGGFRPRPLPHSSLRTPPLPPRLPRPRNPAPDPTSTLDSTDTPFSFSVNTPIGAGDLNLVAELRAPIDGFAAVELTSLPSVRSAPILYSRKTRFQMWVRHLILGILRYRGAKDRVAWWRTRGSEDKGHRHSNRRLRAEDNKEGEWTRNKVGVNWQKFEVVQEQWSRDASRNLRKAANAKVEITVK